MAAYQLSSISVQTNLAATHAMALDQASKGCIVLYATLSAALDRAMHVTGM
jgi:hypothetical protein